MATDTLWIMFDIESVKVCWIVSIHSAYLHESSKDFMFLFKAHVAMTGS